MARYKTLQNILDQNSWSGLDVGKADLISFINKKVDKPGLDYNTLSSMLETLSYKQKEIYKNYTDLKEALSFLYNRATALKQQFFNSFNFLTKQLTLLQDRENSYIEYLSQPLTLSNKIMEDIEKQFLKEFTCDNTPALSIIFHSIKENVEVYEAYREAVTPEYLIIFDKYAKEYTERELPINLLATDKGEESFLQALLNSFSKIYKTDNSIDKVIEYITNKEGEPILIDIGLSKDQQKKLKNAGDYTSILIKYDAYLSSKAEYTGEPYTSILNSKSLEITYTKEKKKLTKLEALKLDIVNMSTDDFIREHTELYNQAKNDLSEFLDVFKKPDNELKDISLKNIDLIKAGILTINSDSLKGYQLQRDFILNSTPKNPKEFLLKERARAGLSVAITPPNENTLKLFSKYGDNYQFLPEDFSIEDCREYQETGLYYSLNYIFTFNKFLEVYSELFKVNLLPLTIKTDFNTYADKYNLLIYELYGSLVGDKTTLKNKRSILKGTFQPLDIESLKPNKEKLDEYTEILKKLAKENLELPTETIIINSFMNNEFKEGIKNGK